MGAIVVWKETLPVPVPDGPVGGEAGFGAQAARPLAMAAAMRAHRPWETDRVDMNPPDRVIPTCPSMTEQCANFVS
jgi:hypothetical protein